MSLSRSLLSYLTMTGLFIILSAALIVGLVFACNENTRSNGSTFTIDHKANTFLLDDKPFRYVSGSFHYFRALPQAWPERLMTMKTAGLNAIDTYVEWSLHNPADGVYNWEGIADVEKFIDMACKEGFYVILRPGPYICAERDNGGIPHWLFNKYPNIKLRTNDPDYLYEVGKWYAQLMPRLQKYWIGNGGPVIMVQVENEYGAFHSCDQDYLNWLRDETERYVQDKALLFTTDIPNDRMKCGKIDGVFATTDFGIDRIGEIDNILNLLRKVQPTGPLVNSEFYPGWLTHWQECNQRRDANSVAEALRSILQTGASVNMYMFFGGTNFGFTAGANDFGFSQYTPDITSYDYDAVMDEAGGITKKFNEIRKVIAEFLDVPKELPNITATPSLSLGLVELQPVASLLNERVLKILRNSVPVSSADPKTFEELNQYSGLVLYETPLPKLVIDPTLLTVKGLRDRAFVFVDGLLVGTLSRQNAINTVPLHKGWGDKLQILVENQGRINFNVANDTKGINCVTIQIADGIHKVLSNWSSTSLPLDVGQLERLVDMHKSGTAFDADVDASTNVLRNGPVIYYGQFNVTKLGDSYLNTSDWGKGVVYINGLNLGRYWPLAGPQLTLYVPKEALRVGENSLIVLEYQRVNRMEDTNVPIMTLDSEPKLDG